MKVSIGVHLKYYQIQWHAQYVCLYTQNLMMKTLAKIFEFVQDRRDKIGQEKDYDQYN